MSADVPLISLSERIAKVKSDLLARVTSEGEERPLPFVDGIEITAQVVAKREKGEDGKAGLSLSVLGFGADAGVDAKTTVARALARKVTVKLSPLLTRAEFAQALSAEERAKVLGIVRRGAVRGGDDGGGEIA